MTATVSLALAAKTFGDVPAADGAGFSLTAAAALVLLARRPRWRDWTPDRRRDVSLLGLGITVNTITLYLAIDRLPLGTSVTIEFLGPLSLALIHARLPRDYVAAAFAILGVALASGAAVSNEPLGLALALVAGSTWALAVVMMRRLIGGGGLPDALVAAIVVAGVAAIPFAVSACLQISRLDTVLLLLAVAIGGRIVPYGFELFALGLMSTGSAGVLLSIVPAIAALSGYLLLDQPFLASQAVGLVVVILAGAIVLRDAPT